MKQFGSKIFYFSDLNDINNKFLSLPLKYTISLTFLSTKNQKIIKINLCIKIKLEKF